MKTSVRRLARAATRFRRTLARRRAAVLATAAAVAIATPASGQTWNGTTANWNVAGNWTPSGVPASATATALNFGGATSYTATDDVGAASSTFTTGALTFNNTSVGGVTIAFSGTTRTLTLATGTSAATPNATLTQLGTGPVAINGTLLLLDTGGGSTATTATTDFAGTGTGDLSINEVRWNVNNSPVARFSGSYGTTVSSWYKQQGNKTITNNTVAGKTLTIGGIALATGNTNNQLTINGSGDTVVGGPISFANQGAGTNSGVLAYAGTGSLTLSGSNTFGTVGGSVTAGGNVTISSGTLNVSNIAGANNNLGNGTSAIVLGSAAAATFNYSGGSTTFTRGFTVGGAGGARVNATTAGQTLTIDTAGVTGTAGTLAVGGAGNVVINPAVSLGTGGLTKLDAGTLTLNGANTYTGPTTVSGGSLVFGPAATLGSTNAFAVAPGATLTLPTAGVSLTTGGSFTAGRTTGSGTDVAGNVALGTGSTLTVAGGGAAGTLSLAGNLSLTAGSAVRFDLSNVTTAGGGVNDLVATTGSLTLPTGTDTVAVHLTGLNGPLAVGSYTLFTYGTLAGGGAANLAAPTGLAAGRSTYTYDASEAGKLKLVVGGGAANLTWAGNGSTNPWDGSTAGVFTGASPDQFFDGDVVNFTDAAAAANRTVTLAGSLAPFAVNVGGTGNYAFAGAGSIVGSATLAKTGAGTLTVATANGYAGATTVSGGTLVVADPSALGAAAAGTTVAAGAQVRIAGGINTPEPFSINGAGVGGNGALQSGGGGANTVSGTVTVQSDASIANP
ncbi:MAG TPA: autotransporter-associated beta strand repeat-containing protein, partial [Humisphaera sp.]